MVFQMRAAADGTTAAARSGYFLGGLLPRPLPDELPVLLGALGGEPPLLPFAMTTSFHVVVLVNFTWRRLTNRILITYCGGVKDEPNYTTRSAACSTAARSEMWTVKEVWCNVGVKFSIEWG